MARSPRLLSHGRLVVLLGALSAFGPLSMDMYLPGLPSMARDLSAPAWAAQLTITASMLGLAGGQLVAGPISDALGRRRPLLAGLAAYVAASLLCAMAPTIWLLLVFRVVQGAAGAAGIVIARAIVRDLHTGVGGGAHLRAAHARQRPRADPGSAGRRRAAARHRLARDLRRPRRRSARCCCSRRGRCCAETLAPAGAARAAASSRPCSVFGRLVRDREYMGYALAMGLAFGAMAAYIGGSPFVLQDIYGASPQVFSLLFALNAGGIVAASQVGRALVDRFGPRALLDAGVTMSAVGGLGVLASVLFDVGLPLLLPSFFVLVACIGLVFPNATALALADHPQHGGERVGRARPQPVRHRRAGGAAGRRRRARTARCRWRSWPRRCRWDRS